MAASRSLGTLTIDLIAKTGGFTQEFDRASRTVKKRSDEIWRSLEKVRLATVASGLAIGGAIALWTKQMTEVGTQIDRLSRLAGSGVAEFQKMAYAAKTVGIEQDKLSDILKDVNDKVGDFLSTGGGELKDFFEDIAPKVGVTAEQFRNLSGPQALELYVSSLEKAGVSQSQMTFYMEAIADDATALIPLLEHNASGLKSLGDEAQRAGAIMSDQAVQAAKDLDHNLDRLDTMVDGVSTTIANSLLPTINNFIEDVTTSADKTDDLYDSAKTLSDDTSLPDWVNTVGIGFARLIDVTVGLGKALNVVVKSFDAVRADLDVGMTKLQSDPLGIIGLFNPEKAAEINDNLKQTLDDRNRIVEDANKALSDLWTYQGNRYEQAWIDAAKRSEMMQAYAGVGETGGVPMLDDVVVKPNKPTKPDTGNTRISEGERYIEQMKRQIEALSKLTEMQKLEQQIAEGALKFNTKAQEDQAIAYAQTIDFIKEQEEAYQKLDESRKEFAAALADAPSFSGIDALIGGAAGEMIKTGEAAEDLQEWYDEQLAMQLEYLEQGVINEQEYADRVYEINKTNAERMESVQRNMRSASISLFSDMTGQTMDMLETLGKKGSGIYKALFLANKAAAIAQAIVNTEEGATKALATLGPAGPPMAFIIRATGYASVAAMAATTIAGMAHDGIDSVPEEGTWLLQKGERVTTAETSAKLDATLERLNSDMSKGQQGGGTVVNVIEDRDRAGTVSTRHEDQQEILDIFVNDIHGGGRTSQMLEHTYGLARRGR